MKTSYDIIGDIHGQFSAFKTLLARLGYHQKGGLIQNPKNRQLISVGDVIDKGPQPFECLDLMAKMVRSNQAQMIIGNHEINAIHYQAGLRPKNPATTKQFATTLSQIAESPDLWRDYEEFILSLPNRLELDDGALRIVHAHWPCDSFPKVIDRSLVTDSGFGGPLHDDLQTMVKGPEVDSAPFVDRQGIERTKDRTLWWETYPEDAPFVAFGHYCFPWAHQPKVPATPQLLGPGRNAACLDFGAGSGDRLVALRYPELEFVAVTV